MNFIRNLLFKFLWTDKAKEEVVKEVSKSLSKETLKKEIKDEIDREILNDLTNTFAVGDEIPYSVTYLSRRGGTRLTPHHCIILGKSEDDVRGFILGKLSREKNWEITSISIRKVSSENIYSKDDYINVAKDE